MRKFHRSFATRSKLSTRGRPHFRSKFELLEGRRLLTVFNVTTTVDRLDPTVTLAHPFAANGTLSLREAISLANSNSGHDTVVLKTGLKYRIALAGAGEDDNQTGDFDVLDDLTITSKGGGNNPIVNGNGLDRVFNIPEGTDDISLTLDHLYITGGIARSSVANKGNGGGVAVEGNNDSLTVTNTTITRNITTSPNGGAGGGIFNNRGDITLINSHVDSNSADAGIAGDGGGIAMFGPTAVFLMRNSTVNDNSSFQGGGGISAASFNDFTVINSEIRHNRCGSQSGGGVFTDSLNVTITDSLIGNNSSGTQGGGFSIDSSSTGVINITNSGFYNNTSVLDGGAMWCAEAIVNITNSVFQNNTSLGSSGGALGNTGETHISDSTFKHNIAATTGGAINQGTEGDFIVERSTFTKNFANNSADEVGGGALVVNGNGNDFSITDSRFSYNGAVASGGAIIGAGDNINLLRTTFDHNTSVTGSGGAIDLRVATHLFFTDSKFTYNTAKADGGAFDAEGAEINLDGCVISFNTATNGSGGGFSDGKDANTGGTSTTIQNTTISGNRAGGNGGGFSVAGETLTMRGSTVSANRSGSDGGGIYIATPGENSDPYPDNIRPGSLIINCTISTNGSFNAGGGIDFEGDGDLTIINTTIVFNASTTGGGLAQTNGSGTIHIGNTIVAKNTATNGPDAYNGTASAFDDLGHNLIFADPDSLFTNPSDIIGQAPLVGPLQFNGGPTKTHALLAGSPAINHADDSLAPPTDQRGVKRPKGPHSDIGAFEKST